MDLEWLYSNLHIIIIILVVAIGILFLFPVILGVDLLNKNKKKRAK